MHCTRVITKTVNYISFCNPQLSGTVIDPTLAMTNSGPNKFHQVKFVSFQRLTDRELCFIAQKISAKSMNTIALIYFGKGFNSVDIGHIISGSEGDTKEQNFCLLETWRNKNAQTSRRVTHKFLSHKIIVTKLKPQLINQTLNKTSVIYFYF